MLLEKLDIYVLVYDNEHIEFCPQQPNLFDIFGTQE